jgi:hypothetical protein
VWESDECTKEEWKFLCKIFGEDPTHTSVIKVTGHVVEAFIVEEIIDDFCMEEDSIFFEEN